MLPAISGYRTRPLLIVLLFVLALGSVSLRGGANPVPEAAQLFHVQSVDPGFCDACPIIYCGQIVQHTEEIGLLEFDLFIHAPWVVWPPQIHSFATVVEWSADWGYVEAQICGGGEGSIELTSPNRAAVDIVWSDCPGWEEGGVFLVARFVRDVTRSGSIRTTDWQQENISLRCPPDTYQPWSMILAHTTARTCAYCPPLCDHGDPCHARFSPSSIDLEVVQGGVL